jgi:Tfp pilus assembly protein PilF
MDIKTAIFGSLILAVSAGSATANDLGRADDLGRQAILEKDWATAEQQLKTGLESNPSDVYRLLNLAAVYSQTGRANEAATIYRQILASDDHRVASLHNREAKPVTSIAERGLSYLEASR